MPDMDFSLFDGVFSPVIILSKNMEIIYKNAFAHRQFPLLSTSAGLKYYFQPKALAEVAPHLLNGHAVRLGLRTNCDEYLLFDPVFTSSGEVGYIRVYMDSDGPCVPLLSDMDVLHSFRSELEEPVLELVEYLSVAEQKTEALKDKDLLNYLRAIRSRLIHISAYTSRVDLCFSVERNPFVMCDANKLLEDYASTIPRIRYTPLESNIYVPLRKDAFTNLLAYAFSSLRNRQDPEGRVSVSLESANRSTIITLSADKMLLPLDHPLSSEPHGVNYGTFPLTRCMGMVGGSVSVNNPTKKRVEIVLTFPSVRFREGEVIVQSPWEERPTLSEKIAKEYLTMLFSDTPDM